jgi:probable O-glycosylation ligase (exosortase A-associated)
MRDLAILLIFAVWMLFALRSPFAGLMSYMWISVMNPHRYVWGFVYTTPLAQAAAAVTIASMALHADQIRFPRTRETFLFFLIWVWISITTLYAFYPTDAWIKWEIVTKIFVMVLVSMLLINTRARLFYYLVGLVVFVGFLGVKGAIFGVLTRGRFRVWGPENTFLADNNSAALAMLMVLPFCFFLRGMVTNKWLSRALFGTGLCCIVSILLTYSRGGLLGLAAVGAFSVLYSRRKFGVAIAVTILVVIGLALLPPVWMERMATIGTYEEDNSANKRLNSWWMSYNLAKANPLGGGFECFTMEQYYRYAPDPELGRLAADVGATAHSIYFEVLATHGFGGLAIFLLCLVSILLSMRRLQRTAAESGGREDVVDLSRAFIISTIGFMVSGAFLSRAFFDLFWSIFAAALCFKSMVLAGEWKLDVASGVAAPGLSPRDSVNPVRALPRVGDAETSLKPGHRT